MEKTENTCPEEREGGLSEKELMAKIWQNPYFQFREENELYLDGLTRTRAWYQVSASILRGDYLEREDESE